MYEDKRLVNLLDNLILENRIKPFECVGTRDELKVGLFLSLKLYEENRLPALLRYAKEHYLKDTENIGELAAKVLNNWDDNNNLPNKFSELLKSQL